MSSLQLIGQTVDNLILPLELLLHRADLVLQLSVFCLKFAHFVFQGKLLSQNALLYGHRCLNLSGLAVLFVLGGAFCCNVF